MVSLTSLLLSDSREAQQTQARGGTVGIGRGIMVVRGCCAAKIGVILHIGILVLSLASSCRFDIVLYPPSSGNFTKCNISTLDK